MFRPVLCLARSLSAADFARSTDAVRLARALAAREDRAGASAAAATTAVAELAHTAGRPRTLRAA